MSSLFSRDHNDWGYTSEESPQIKEYAVIMSLINV